MLSDFPSLIATVLDAEDSVGLARFWHEFLGLSYRPQQGPEDDPQFIVLDGPDGDPQLAVQQVGSLPPATWPVGDIPQQMHLDLLVRTAEDQQRQIDRAVERGARVLDDRRSNADDPLVVLADPAGHPFCLIRPPDRD